MSNFLFEQIFGNQDGLKEPKINESSEPRTPSEFANAVNAAASTRNESVSSEQRLQKPFRVIEKLFCGHPKEIEAAKNIAREILADAKSRIQA